MQIQVVVVGASAVGKTSLLVRMFCNRFPVDCRGEHVGTVHEFTIDGHECYLWCSDASDEEGCWRLRPILYPQPGTFHSVFLLCFDVFNRKSFDDIEAHWLAELRFFKPDIPIVLVGTKSDLREKKNTDDLETLYSASYWKQIVTEAEGEALAKKHNLYSYVECSALLDIGVDTVLTTVVRAARANVSRHKSLSWLQRKRQLKVESENQNKWLSVRSVYNVALEARLEARLARPPWLSNDPQEPPQNTEVKVELKTSTFAEDFGKLLEERYFADVEFVLTDRSRETNKLSDDIQARDSNQLPDRTLDTNDLSASKPLTAHQVVLSAASSVFHEVFSNEESFVTCRQKNVIFDEITCESRSYSARESGGQIARNSQNCTRMVRIKLNKLSSSEAFKIIIHFLYTGTVPRNVDSSDQEFVLEVKKVAEVFKLSWLENICVNVLQEEDLLNQSIGSWLNDKTGAKMKEMFLNKPMLSDVMFNVEGHVINAHKAVLIARCDVMAAMFGGAFREGQTSIEEIPLPDVKLDPFLAVLEYLYSDHVTLQQADPRDVLVLADRYFIARLVTLCEVEIHRRLQEEMTKSDDVIKDVIQLLLWSQMYNASQLHKWCLYHVACHYVEFEATEDFRLLEGENKDFVMRHRWPPVEYLERVKEYEETKQLHSSKCNVM